MPEPTSSATALIITTASTAAGLTICGVATGLHPNILIAGLFGGLWALSYQPPAGIVPRVLFMLGSSLVAGYVAPVAASVAASAAASLFPWWPRDITHEAIQYPVAFFTGFLALRWLGPALMRRAEKLEAEH